MGLDMYLTRESYFGKGKIKEISFVTNHKPFYNEEVTKIIKSDKIAKIEEEVGYWRKANAIHKWFVDNVQGGIDECEKSWVNVDQLKELLNVVQVVLDNPNKAQELLPTQAGFFFGETEYDEYYIQDLKDTKQIIEEILQEDPEGKGTYFYQSSW
jgi:hypothetical protein